MKKIVLIFVLCFLGLLYFNTPTSAGILDWKVSGWIEGSVYPPHNEFDPNPGVEFKDRITARYGLGGYLELRPKDFNRLFVFVEPLALFGDSRPQTDYNWSCNPIVLNLKYGAGYQISKKPDIQIRITHGRWIDLGGYQGEKLQWNGAQLRWTFGK